MNERDKDMLVDLIEKIDALSAVMASVETEYGPNIGGMYVEHDEISRLEINLDTIDNALGNLKDYVKQHIKEEEDYHAQLEEA